MARCEQGYLCVVCHREVAELRDSALYLRYVLGEIAPEELHRVPECHLRCDPNLAQYIDDPGFPPVECIGPFDKRALDGEFVRREQARVSQGWRRLRELSASEQGLLDYPISSATASEYRAN